MKTQLYHYETHTSTSPIAIRAQNDEEVLKKLRVKYGENLRGVVVVYLEEEEEGEFRTVWLE